VARACVRAGHRISRPTGGEQGTMPEVWQMSAGTGKRDLVSPAEKTEKNFRGDPAHLTRRPQDRHAEGR